MHTALVYSPEMAAYRFGADHPLLPERFTLAVELMDAWNLLGDATSQARVISPAPAGEEDLLRVHSARYVDVVRDARGSRLADETAGIGPGDTPRFPGMHDVAALIAGGTLRGSISLSKATSTAHSARRAGCTMLIVTGRPGSASTTTALSRSLTPRRNAPGCASPTSTSMRTMVTASRRRSGPGPTCSPSRCTSRAAICTREPEPPATWAKVPGRGYAVNVPMPPYAGPAEYAARVRPRRRARAAGVRARRDRGSARRRLAPERSTHSPRADRGRACGDWSRGLSTRPTSCVRGRSWRPAAAATRPSRRRLGCGRARWRCCSMSSPRRSCRRRGSSYRHAWRRSTGSQPVAVTGTFDEASWPNLSCPPRRSGRSPSMPSSRRARVRRSSAGPRT